MGLAKGIFFFLNFLFHLIYFYILEIVKLFIPRQRKDVSGEIVLITGAGHGIGKEIALEFGRLGAKVVIWDINKSTNEETADEIKRNGGTAYPYVCDLTKSDNIKTLAAQVRIDIGDPSILINNAGILYGGELLKLQEVHIRRTFEVNTLSHFWMVKEFLPSMINKNKGHIVTMASMSAKSGTAYLTDYSSSKYAAFGFTEALREELDILGHDGIQTTTVCPMFVDTGLCKNPRDGLGKLLAPKDVAMATVNGTLTNQVVVYIPGSLHLQLRIFALFPPAMGKWLKKFSNTGIEPQYDPSSFKQD